MIFSITQRISEFLRFLAWFLQNLVIKNENRLKFFGKWKNSLFVNKSFITLKNTSTHQFVAQERISASLWSAFSLVLPLFSAVLTHTFCIEDAPLSASGTLQENFTSTIGGFVFGLSMAIKKPWVSSDVRLAIHVCQRKQKVPHENQCFLCDMERYFEKFQSTV